MKNFELKPIYYPKGSYLNYILEIWIDGVNISQFYEDGKLKIDTGYIFHIYNFFDYYLENILKEEVLQRAHRWLLSGPFLCIPDIIFRRVKDKIEISWDTTWDIRYQQRKYENKNIKFISTKGVSYVDIDDFYLEVKKILKK